MFIDDMLTPEPEKPDEREAWRNSMIVRAPFRSSAEMEAYEAEALKQTLGNALPIPFLNPDGFVDVSRDDEKKLDELNITVAEWLELLNIQKEIKND